MKTARPSAARRSLLIGGLLASFTSSGARPARAAAPEVAAASSETREGPRGEGAASPVSSVPRLAGPDTALFALIIGVNRSPDRDRPPLRYADDDAARYRDLFQMLGARTSLLATFDDNTRGLHPQAVAEARPARLSELHQAVSRLEAEARKARAEGKKVALYVVYAGHGDDDDRQPFLTFEDGRLDAEHLLSDVVAPPAADETHVIIDACHAYLFALPRGPGGVRRPVEGFVDRAAKQKGANLPGEVGFLLASSANGESHEWAGFEAGVFSHEIRSGLYGAADADGDGVVTYTEMAAFVTRANAGIVAEKFRPQIVVRPPTKSRTLLDLRAHPRDLRFAGPQAHGHFLIEDVQGVRLADFNAGGNTAVALVRPRPGALFARRLPGGEERALPPYQAAQSPLDVLALPLEAPRERTRGAASHAFSQAFVLPFDQETVVAYDEAVRSVEQEERGAAEKDHRFRRTVALTAFGVSAASLALGAGFGIATLAARNDTAGLNQQQFAARNDLIDARLRWTLAGLGGAAVAALVGSYFFWEF